jgi:hypothetical protein
MIVPVFGFKMIGEPLQKILGKINSIGKGDFAKPLEIKKNDELAVLAKGINDRAAGCLVTECKNGIEFISKLESFILKKAPANFDIIISDIRMPA